MTILKRSFKYIFLFVFFLLALVIFGYYNNQFDAIWNYGYSYAISIGEIPYRDFTLLTTPLFPYVFSIGLFLFSHDNIIFLIEQALLLTLTFYFLFKIFGKKAWIMLLVMCFPLLNGIIPTYNYFAFFLIVVVIFLEKEKKSDYLVGFVLGLIFLTKQSIGVFLLLPTFLLYYKDFKKIIRRLIPFFSLCLIFLFYLVVTNSLYQFLDICVLGLFDFTNHNSVLFTPYFFLAIGMEVILFLLWRKDKKNILYYYSFCCFSFLIPIFTGYHFVLFFISFMLSIIPFISLPDYYSKWFSIIFSFGIAIFNFIAIYSGTQTVFLQGVDNFKYYLVLEGTDKTFYKTIELYDKYRTKEKSPIFLGTQSIYFTIINEERVDYFDILNRGNYGYNGTEKMINKIKKMDNQIFIINMDKYKDASSVDQLDTEIIKYVIKHSKKIDSWDCYDVYLKE